MKAIICMVWGDLEIYSPGTDAWRRCPCGGSAAKWDDPGAGRLVVAARDRKRVRGLGLVNTILLDALNNDHQTWQDFRTLHRYATGLSGYIFHGNKAACWAAPFIIGSTSDTRWATDEEYIEVFPS